MRSPYGDIDPDELRARLHEMADWVADYRANIEDRPVASRVNPGDVGELLDSATWETGASLDDIMSDLDKIVMPGILNWGHPAFLGYFGSTSNGPALLGEIAAAALNVSAMTWKTSPAATEMETVTVNWIRQMIGLDPHFTGIVYDTASISTLHALAAAREACGDDIRRSGMSNRDTPTLRVYVSDQGHSSVAKAAILLGIGESNVVKIPTTAEFTMNPELLQQAVAADIANGLKPMAVVATVGSTSTASVDPVPAIAEICRRHMIWLHVDAAYGGAMAIMPEGRWVMSGCELADSVVVNPHKWMFVPLDFSVLFMRNPELLRSVFALTPEYLRGDSGDDVINYMDFGIQLGRRFRALKAWMTFRAFGRSGLESRIREHCRLAHDLAMAIDGEPHFSLSAPVVMAVLCFRYEPPGYRDDEIDHLNESIAESVNATGRAYITHTELKGRTVLRVGIGNISTQSSHVTDVWNCIVEIAKQRGPQSKSTPAP